MLDNQQFMADKTFWSVVVLFVMGAMARTLISDEPFRARKFFGEMLFSAIGAVILFSFGLLQGMSAVQIIFFGGLGSLGGVRLLQWLFKIAQKVKQVV